MKKGTRRRYAETKNPEFRDHCRDCKSMNEIGQICLTAEPTLADLWCEMSYSHSDAMRPEQPDARFAHHRVLRPDLD